MVREEAISLSLGYISIVCWLGAQFPQIVVNWKRKSVDGLALPFLANWLLGDSTNLIGCLLTDQLPFQTYLASYFVFVDACLISQFIYYDAPRHTKALSILTSSPARQSRSSLLLPSAISYSPDTYTFPQSHVSRSRGGSYSVDPQLRSAMANIALATSELDARHTESLASEVDIHGSQGRWRGRGGRRANSLEGLPESIVADHHEHPWGGRRLTSTDREAGDTAADAESASVSSLMIDSFHSEGGSRGRGKGKHVSWSRDSTSRDRSKRILPQDPESPSTAAPTVRGRQLSRETAYDSPVVTEAPPVLVDTIPSSRRASVSSTISAAASRRGAGIVFLSVFALFGIYSRTGYRSSGRSEGVVLSMPPNSEVLVPKDIPSSLPFAHTTTHLSPELAQESLLPLNDFEVDISAHGDTQRFIGRISAWTCTTLYITSRLPQIWKNFARKSVEGLSMYLFVFAFLGNFFYVLSILTNPKMDQAPPLARKFLRDSVPYLLGSGGTLLFDITIVIQSFVYAPSRRGSRTRARRKSLVRAGGEEERALLEAENANEDTR